MSELVSRVEKIKFNQGDTPITVVAEGVVPTLGWKDGMLSPFLYFVVPTDDRIQDYSFGATPPDDGAIVGEVETPIESHPAKVPEWAIGVRIHAKSNVLVEMI